MSSSEKITPAAKATKSGRGRGRPPKFDRSTAVDAAMRLFWEFGYDAVSYEDLIREMGIGPGSLVNSFGNKEKLFKEALEAYLQGPGSFLPCVLEEVGDAREAFRQMLIRFAEESTRESAPKGCFISLSGFDLSADQENIRKFTRETRAWVERGMYRRLERARAERDIPEDCDTRQLAAYYVAVVRGMAVAAKDGGSTESLMSIVDLAMKAWPRP